MKSAERLAFEADRMRLRLELRLVTKEIANDLEHELEIIHYNANQRGVIPKVTLEPRDVATIERSSRKLIGDLQTESA